MGILLEITWINFTSSLTQTILTSCRGKELTQNPSREEYNTRHAFISAWSEFLKFGFSQILHGQEKHWQSVYCKSFRHRKDHVWKIKYLMCIKKEQTSYSSSVETFRRSELEMWRRPSAVSKQILLYSTHRTDVSWLAGWKDLFCDFMPVIENQFIYCCHALNVNLGYRPWNRFLFLHKPGLFPRFCNYYEVLRKHIRCATWRPPRLMPFVW